MKDEQKERLRLEASDTWSPELKDAIEAALKEVEELRHLSDRVSAALEWAVKPPPGYCERTSMEMSEMLIPPRLGDPS